MNRDDPLNSDLQMHCIVFQIQPTFRTPSSYRKHGPKILSARSMGQPLFLITHLTHHHIEQDPSKAFPRRPRAVKLPSRSLYCTTQPCSFSSPGFFSRGLSLSCLTPTFSRCVFSLDSTLFCLTHSFFPPSSCQGQSSFDSTGA